MVPVENIRHSWSLVGSRFLFLPFIPLLESPRVREVRRSSGANPPLPPLSPDKLRRP